MFTTHDTAPYCTELAVSKYTLPYHIVLALYSPNHIAPDCIEPYCTSPYFRTANTTPNYTSPHCSRRTTPHGFAPVLSHHSSRTISQHKKVQVEKRSGKGAIRKRFPLQKPRREKTKLTIRYLYHETYRKPNEQLFSQ